MVTWFSASKQKCIAVDECETRHIGRQALSRLKAGSLTFWWDGLGALPQQLATRTFEVIITHHHIVVNA